MKSGNAVVTGVRKAALSLTVAAIVLVGGVRVGVAVAAQDASAQAQAGNDPDAKRREKNIAAGEANAKQMLLLMDRDQSGKVSKQEFMSFMEAEFDRLDKNKDGQLDVKELVQYRFAPRAGGSRR